MGDVWAVAGAYEEYVGRWSRRVAAEFVRWLEVPAGRRWLDAGCGTGALAETVVDATAPALVLGVDMSRGFLGEARRRVPGARFAAGDARYAVHPFFGPLTKDEWLIWGYRHTDHHLRQFAL